MMIILTNIICRGGDQAARLHAGPAAGGTKTNTNKQQQTISTNENNETIFQKHKNKYYDKKQKTYRQTYNT